MINKEYKDNEFYTLQSLETYNLTTLRYRQLKNRIKELIIAKDSLIGNLIYKRSNRWYIHVTAIDKFKAKRVHDKTKVRAINYKNEISINLPTNYDIAFYMYLGTTIAKALNGSKTIFSIETKNDSYHLHAGTTAQTHIIIKELKAIEKRLSLKILGNKNTMIQPIRFLKNFVHYISKQSVLIT